METTADFVKVFQSFISILPTLSIIGIIISIIILIILFALLFKIKNLLQDILIQLKSPSYPERNTSENEWECPKCKSSNPNNSFKCIKCGYSLK